MAQFRWLVAFLRREICKKYDSEGAEEWADGKRAATWKNNIPSASNKEYCTDITCDIAITGDEHLDVTCWKWQLVIFWLNNLYSTANNWNAKWPHSEDKRDGSSVC